MVFTVSDFESYSVGTSNPGNYSGFTDNDGPYEVSDDSPIQGDKSYLFQDAGGGWTGVRHPMSTETVVFALDVNRDAPLVGDRRQIHLGAKDSNNNFAYSYVLADDGAGDFEIFYDTNRSSRQNDQSGDTGPLIGYTTVGFHEFRLENPATALQLVIDGNVIHESGDSFSDLQRFEWATDDMEVRIDSQVGYSQFVFHQGNRVALGSGGQSFVYEGGKNEESQVSNSGESSFVKIQGTGIGYEQ